jgi:aspartyl-tRNA synthetase
MKSLNVLTLKQAISKLKKKEISHAELYKDVASAIAEKNPSLNIYLAQDSKALEKAKDQFGFLMNAFEYGAPPHGGIAFGLDRLTAILGGQETIRDFIAFPKNNSGRDVMIDAPAQIDDEQLKELCLKINLPL